ncbi:MAG: GAF domain-containing protein [Chloroflexi bacterium]|nr:GAF domain-containing protein [Chloroflexota bacterium]MCC6894341.1 GAF domain-containing protein [Anaerolineae bacterium]
MQTVLVVSDKPDTRQKLCETYLHSGFTVLEAENPQACFAAVQQQLPHIILLYLTKIPEAINTCVRLTNDYHVPVLFMTTEAHIEKALDAGAQDVVLTASPRFVLHRTRIILEMIQAKKQRALAEALRDTGIMLNRVLSVEVILDRILELIQGVIPNDLCTIYMIDVEKQEARTVRTISPNHPDLEEAISSVVLPIHEMSHLRQMMETKAPLLIEDTRKLASWEIYPPTAWIRSVVSTPILVEGAVLGFIFVNAERPNAFTPADCETLQIFAIQASLAMANANLYEARSRYAESLQQEVSKRTAELEHKSNQLEVILESIGEGVQGVIFGENSQSTSYSFTNTALYDLLGYEHDELTTLDHLRPNDVDSASFAAVTGEALKTVIEKGLWKGERRLKHRDGWVVDTEMIASRLNDADGRIMGMVTIFRDLRQQKILDAEKTQFVTNAAHELRNPIAALKARLYLLEKQPDRLTSHLDILDRISTHMDNLVERLLDLARLRNGLISLHDNVIELTSFVRDTILMMEAESELKDIWLIDKLSHKPIYVSIDQTRMLQVITNLVSNAVKFTPENGSITIYVQPGADGTPEEGWAVIKIIDTGSGIPPEHLPFIFDRFYQAGKTGRGLGLGLAIIKEIIALHGGKISVESEVDKGTTFTVLLKLVPKP